MNALLGHACCGSDISKLLTKCSQKKEKLFIKTQVENKELKHDNFHFFSAYTRTRNEKTNEHLKLSSSDKFN